MNNDILVIASFVGIGAYALFIAGMTRAGRMREWFAFRPNPIMPKDVVYGTIPLGVGFILVGLSFAVKNRNIGLLGLFGGGALGFVLMLWKPRWLKPDWLLRLEDEYGPEMAERMLQTGQVPPYAQPVWVSADDSPKKRRLSAMAIGLALTICFSVILIIGLDKDCSAVSGTECRFLWRITSVSVIGGALLTEVLIKRRQTINISLSDLDVSTKSLYIIYIVVFGLLTAVPILVRGSVILAFFGALVGLSLDLFIRAVLNRLPPPIDE